jgi:hypothetical protein
LSRNPTLLAMAAGLLVPFSPAFAELNPAGSTIYQAALVDVTEQGCATLGTLAPALVPSSIDIPDVSSSGDCAWILPMDYSLTNGWVTISGATATITPSAGVLHVDADFSVSLNSSSDPFYFYYDVCGISGTCDGRVEAFPANVTFDLGLEVVPGPDGQPTLDATVANLAVSYDLSSDDIAMSGCFISDLEDVLGYIGLSLYDLVLGYADSYIQTAVADFAAQMEAMIESTFGAATIDTTVPLASTTLQVHIWPSDVDVTSAGIRLAMDGAMSAEPNACVADYDQGGSLKTASQPPDLGDAPSGIDPYDVGLLASDDIANQAMYAAWRGGLLCYTLDESFTAFPVNTSIFSLMNVSAFDEIFPEVAPMEIVTRPRLAPTVTWGGTHDADIHVQDLGLDFFGEVDHRMALVMGLDLAAQAGADIGLDPSSGTLGVALDISGDDVTVSMRANELAPDSSDEIVANFGGLVDTLLPTLLGGLGEAISYPLPSFSGIGLTSLQVSAAGEAGDWLGAYTSLGLVSYASKGCSGGSSTGCGKTGGCSDAGGAGSGLAILPLLGLLAVRRRKSRG